MKTSVKFTSLCFASLFSLNAWGLTIQGGTIDVGDLDNIIASTTLANSGSASEEAWVESVLNFDVSFDYKNDGAFAWQQVDSFSDYYAQELSTNPEYFLVKLGGGNLDIDTHFLFENFDSSSFAVIDLTAFGTDVSIDVARVSHISEFNGSTATSVPEPQTLALFGMGLLGLVGINKRRRKI